MSYNAKIKTLFLLFSLFLTGLFFNVQNVYAVNSELYKTDNGTGLTKIYIENNYYEDGNLMFEFSYSADSTYKYADADTYKIYFENYDFTQEPYHYLRLRNSNDSANINFRIVNCDYSYKETKKDSYNNYNSFCVMPRGSSIKLYPRQIIYNGTTITNNNGLTKTDIDNAFGTNFLESSRGFTSLQQLYHTPVNDKIQNGGYLYHYLTGYRETVLGFPLGSAIPPIIDGTCGLDNGETISSEPPTPPRTLCSTGTATSVLYSDYSWFWTCEGSGGGTTANCIAYETFVPATCGLDNGQTVSEVDDFCSYGSLIVPSLVETITGWNWTCQRDSTYAYCSAIRGSVLPPELPDLEDCTLLSVPDKWWCQISNAVQGAFLPTPSKLNELNTTVNVIGQRFPFNYIQSAKYSIETISISTAVPTITIMGNTGALNINAISNFATVVRNGTSILIIFAFLFWLLGYIKNFFR